MPYYEKEVVQKLHLRVSKEAAQRIHAAAVERTRNSIGHVTTGMVVNELAMQYLTESPEELGVMPVRKPARRQGKRRRVAA